MSSSSSVAVLSGAEIEPTQTEREHMQHYPLDAAVEIARAAIRREPEHNRISLGGAAIEAHAVESLIGHTAWLLAQLREARKDSARIDEIARIAETDTGLTLYARHNFRNTAKYSLWVSAEHIGHDGDLRALLDRSASTPQPEAHER